MPPKPVPKIPKPNHINKASLVPAAIVRRIEPEINPMKYEIKTFFLPNRSAKNPHDIFPSKLPMNNIVALTDATCLSKPLSLKKRNALVVIPIIV